MTRRQINRISLGLLLTGFLSALIIHVVVEPPVKDPLLGDPLESKRFRRELKVLGGQANVLSAEFQDWFASLWQGERLAGTVAVLTVLTTLGFRFIATHPGAPAAQTAAKPPPESPDSKG